MDEPSLNPYSLSTPEPVSATVIEPAEISCRPWGFWATIGWSLLCVVLFVIVQTVVAVGIFLVSSGGTFSEELGEQVEGNGLALALATCATTVVGTIYLSLIVYLRGCPIADYFALKRVNVATTWKSIGLLLLLIALTDGLTYLLGRPIVPEFMSQVYRSAGFLPLLAFAVIVAAPVFEELFFRGFLHRGLAASRLGDTGAVLLCSASWAAIHMQYDWYGIGTIFLMGLFLGAVRVKTGSTALTILLHGVANLAATIECIVKVEILGG